VQPFGVLIVTILIAPRMRHLHNRFVGAAHRLIGAVLLSVIGGCQIFDGDLPLMPAGESPLRAATASPDSVTLEIFWARFPAGSPALNDDVWREIQEDRLPSDLRARLAAQGLRAGVVGGTPPAAILAMLNPAERKSDEPVADEQIDPAALGESPKVTRRVKQLRFGTRMELQASDVIEQAALLVPAEGELGGGTYGLAQAIYQLEARLRESGQVELQITPELQHGPQQMRWQRDELGNLVPKPLRDAEVFRDLRMTVPLAPGEMFIVLGLPDAAGRLGHYFHTVETATGLEQKAVVIRLTDGPKSEVFQTAHADAAGWFR
jgi:hypothetical protein